MRGLLSNLYVLATDNATMLVLGGYLGHRFGDRVEKFVGRVLGAFKKP